MKTKKKVPTVFYWMSSFDGCAWVRCMMPGYYGNMSGAFVSQGSLRPVREMEKADIIVAQRRFLDPDLIVLRTLKNEYGKKIVVDMDDQLLNLPPKNPASRVYTPALKRNVKACLNMADLITVSTDYLADQMRRYNDNVVVLPNSIDPTWNSDANGPTCKTKSDGKIKIGWVGSKTHDEDLREVEQVMIDLLSEREDVEILYMGGYPASIIEPLIDEGLVFRNEAQNLVIRSAEIADKKKIWLVKGVPVQDYYNRLMTLGIHIGIAPLVDNTFNRSKSNLKYLEYTLAGVPTIASNVLPYSSTITDGVNGIIVKKNRYNLWKRAIENLIENEKKRVDLFEGAKRLLCKEYDVRQNILKWRAEWMNLLREAA